MIESVLTAVDNNPNLTADIKDVIKNLITVFNKFFPTISLDNLKRRMETLKIEGTNRMVSKRIYDYYPLTNVLSISKAKLEQEYDARHIMMCAILNIMTAHDNTYGFDIDNKLVAFNTGYTEILSNFIIGNDGEMSLFNEEVIATNLMCEVVGSDVFFEAYFSNNPKLIFDAIAKESVG